MNEIERTVRRLSKRLTDGYVKNSKIVSAVPRPGSYRINEDGSVEFQYRRYGTRRHAWVAADDCLNTVQLRELRS